MAASDELCIVPGVYQHYKGNRYTVIGIGQATETEERVVIYAPLYKSDIEYWVRPYSIFIGNVVVAGRHVPRFIKIS